MIESKVLGSPAHLNSHPSLEFTGNWFVDAGKMIEGYYRFSFEDGENYDGRSVS